MHYSSAAGPQPQGVLFVLIDKDHGIRCLLLATGLSPCLRPSSPSDTKIGEDGHLLRSFPFVDFSVPDVLSSRTFSDWTEGGVPNSSPSEPQSDLRERRGFDSVGALSVPKRWTVVASEAQSVLTCEKVVLPSRKQKFSCLNH